MTNVKFNRKEFEKQVPLTDEVIEKISLFGTPLEASNDEEIEIEIFPNRPDLISLHGFIRSFKNFLSKSGEAKKYSMSRPRENYRVEISPSVKDRPTACAIVTGLKLDDSKIKEIIELQEKLHFTVGRNRKKASIGIYPLNKISLPIKYEARAPEKIKFKPLGSEAEMTAAQILEKTSVGKEYAPLLEGKEKYPVFSDADGKILSMPPIINSEETGRVTEETQDVFIECSGTHFETLSKVLNIIVTMLADMGGKICQMELDYSGRKIITPDLSSEKVKISLENVNRLLGLNLKEKETEKLLLRMGHEYKNKTVFVPAWRTDVLHEVDLIEDIAIAYGYNNLTPEIPNVATIGAESDSSRKRAKLSEILVGLKLTEIMTYHLIRKREADITGIKELIEVENSKTEFKILRPNLLIPMLRTFAENKDNDYPQNLFEIGTIFYLDKKEETGISEEERVIVALSPENSTAMKQLVDYLARLFGKNFELSDEKIPALADGRAAALLLNGDKIGYFGEVHPETLREWGIKMPVAVCEIDVESLF